MGLRREEEGDTDVEEHNRMCLELLAEMEVSSDTSSDSENCVFNNRGVLSDSGDSCREDGGNDRVRLLRETGSCDEEEGIKCLRSIKVI